MIPTDLWELSTGQDGNPFREAIESSVTQVNITDSDETTLIFDLAWGHLPYYNDNSTAIKRLLACSQYVDLTIKCKFEDYQADIKWIDCMELTKDLHSKAEIHSLMLEYAADPNKTRQRLRRELPEWQGVQSAQILCCLLLIENQILTLQ